MRNLLSYSVLLPLLLVQPMPVGAQSLGKVIERSAEREAKRQAERRTREAVQCVTGARDCLPDDPPPKPAEPATGKAPRAVAAQPVDPYLLPSGTAATSAAAAPFTAPPLASGTIVSNDVMENASYLRIIGYADSRVITASHRGRLTRTQYAMGGAAPSAVIGALRAELERQGFVIEWDCSRRQGCGTTARHDAGRGWNGVNGLNLGIAADVRYLTARRDRDGRPAVYVSAGASASVGHVHVVELP